jgi:hypothetical protein
MGLATTTLEMRSPEEHRERLHEIVKAASSVMVLARVAGQRGAKRDVIDGWPMALVRTADDTTMYAAVRLDADQAEELEHASQVTVVVLGAGHALFTAEARISRDPRLLDEVRRLGPGRPGVRDDVRTHRCGGAADPSLAIVVLLPLEGSYWNANGRHSYTYRFVPHVTRDHESDGVPIEL